MRGTDQFIKKLKKLKAETQANIKEELEATATDIEIAAYRAAPVAIGQKITKRATNGGFTQSIEVNAGPIGAYIEFGTGSSAASLVPTLPAEWQEIARTFYINGKGTLIAAPYLYPNYKRFTADLPKRLKLILKEAAR